MSHPESRLAGPRAGAGSAANTSIENLCHCLNTISTLQLKISAPILDDCFLLNGPEVGFD
jgi:hypothetical protein